MINPDPININNQNIVPTYGPFPNLILVKITPGPPNMKKSIGKKKPKAHVTMISCITADNPNTKYIALDLLTLPFVNLIAS